MIHNLAYVLAKLTLLDFTYILWLHGWKIRFCVDFTFLGTASWFLGRPRLAEFLLCFSGVEDILGRCMMYFQPTRPFPRILLLSWRPNSSKRHVFVPLLLEKVAFLLILVNILIYRHFLLGFLVLTSKRQSRLSGRIFLYLFFFFRLVFNTTIFLFRPGVAVTSALFAYGAHIVMSMAMPMFSAMLMLLQMALQLPFERGLLYLEFLWGILIFHSLYSSLHFWYITLFFKLLAGLFVEILLFLLHLGQLRAGLQFDFGRAVFWVQPLFGQEFVRVG